MPGELQPLAPDHPENFLEAVIRAAADPNVDPDRLEKLLAIGVQLEQQRALGAYNAAFAAMKKDLPVIDKNGVVLNKSGKVQFKFARYDDLHEGISPILEKYGFATSFNFEEPGPNRLTCILELSHANQFKTSYSKFFRWTLPAMGENQYVNNLQNAAAARSFAKRCVLIDALDILTKDTDRDGATQPAAQPITEDQAKKIDDVLAACEKAEPGSTARAMKWIKAEMKVEQIRELLQGDQQKAVMLMLKAKAEGLGIK